MARASKINGSMRHLQGWSKDLPDHRDYLLEFGSFAQLPESVDLRAFCSPIEDQGKLGSCTAHSSTSAVEFLYKKKTGEAPIEFSRLFLYYATRVKVMGKPATEDSGATNRDAVKAMAKFGNCDEKLWPYKVAQFSKAPAKATWDSATNHQILSYHKITGLHNLKSCLSQGYPFIGGVVLPNSIYSEATSVTGMVQYPQDNEGYAGGHSILFVGYDDRKGFLLFKNSWGMKWGDKGFGYLPYAFVSSGLADDFWTVRTAEM